MNKNIIGFSLSEKLESKINNYDKSLVNRQIELENKVNQLILDFQKKEKVVVIINYNIEKFEINPVETRLIVDLKQ